MRWRWRFADREITPAQIALGLTALLLMAYVTARAALMSITHDEAVTYLVHMKRGFRGIFDYVPDGYAANNHLLLTLLADASERVFGMSEFAIRLPMLFAYALFLVSLIAILSMFLRGWTLWLYFTFIAANPFLIEMMSVARGYGLATSLITAGFYLLLRANAGSPQPARRLKLVCCAEVLFALAVLAQFSFLLVFLSVVGLRGLIVVVAAFRRRVAVKFAVLEVAFSGLLTLALAATIAPAIRVINEEGYLVTDETGSFFSHTVQDAVVASLQNFAASGLVTAVAVLCCALVGAAVVLLWRRARTVADNPELSALAMITTVVVATCIATVLQHHLLGVDYLASRRTVFLVPLFGLICALMLAHSQTATGRLARPARAVLIAFPLLLLPPFLASANLSRVLEWAYDIDTKDMMSDLAAAAQPVEAGRQVSLGVHWFYEPGINFYIAKGHLAWLQDVTRTEWISGEHDFYYIPQRTLSDVETRAGKLAVLKTYPRTGMMLARRQVALSDSDP